MTNFSWVASILLASKDVHLLRGELLGRQHFPLGEGSITVHVHPHESALDLGMRGRGGEIRHQEQSNRDTVQFLSDKTKGEHYNNLQYWLVKPHGTSA